MPIVYCRHIGLYSEGVSQQADVGDCGTPRVHMHHNSADHGSKAEELRGLGFVIGDTPDAIMFSVVCRLQAQGFNERRWRRDPSN